MASTGTTSIEDQLQAQADTLKSQADSLRKQLADVEDEYQRIQSAADILAGKGKVSKPSSATAKKRKQGKPAPTRAHVIKCMTVILTDNPVLESDELEELTKDKLSEEGFSKNGFVLRFKEALAGEDFVETPGGVRIKQEEPAHA